MEPEHSKGLSRLRIGNFRKTKGVVSTCPCQRFSEVARSVGTRRAGRAQGGDWRRLSRKGPRCTHSSCRGATGHNAEGHFTSGAPDTPPVTPLPRREQRAPASPSDEAPADRRVFTPSPGHTTADSRFSRCGSGGLGLRSPMQYLPVSISSTSFLI